MVPDGVRFVFGQWRLFPLNLYFLASARLLLALFISTQWPQPGPRCSRQPQPGRSAWRISASRSPKTKIPTSKNKYINIYLYYYKLSLSRQKIMGLKLKKPRRILSDHKGSSYRSYCHPWVCGEAVQIAEEANNCCISLFTIILKSQYSNHTFISLIQVYYHPFTLSAATSKAPG